MLGKLVQWPYNLGVHGSKICKWWVLTLRGMAVVQYGSKKMSYLICLELHIASDTAPGRIERRTMHFISLVDYLNHGASLASCSHASNQKRMYLMERRKEAKELKRVEKGKLLKMSAQKKRINEITA